MPTEELEQELRRLFAMAAADHQNRELARQRLLQGNYRPGKAHRPPAAGLTAIAAAGAVVLGLGLSGALRSAPTRETSALGSAPTHGTSVSGSAPTHGTSVPGGAPTRGTSVPGGAPKRGTGTIRTAAFILSRSADGSVTLTINPRVLFDAPTLQNDLAQFGIPAKVTAGSFCSSNPAPQGLAQVVTSSPSTSGGTSQVITINPAAMPAGTELSFGSFRVATGQETLFTLIDTGSYVCTSTPPTAGSGIGGLVHGGPERK